MNKKDIYSTLEKHKDKIVTINWDRNNGLVKRECFVKKSSGDFFLPFYYKNKIQEDCALDLSQIGYDNIISITPL